MTLYHLAGIVTFAGFFAVATRKLLPPAVWEPLLLIGVAVAIVLVSAFHDEIEAALGQPTPLEVAGGEP